MKNLKTLAILLVSVIITSCSKSDEPEPTPAPLPATNGSFIRATVDGVAFTSAIFGVETTVVNRVGTGSSRLITLLGGNAIVSTMNIAIEGVTAPGTYVINSTSSNSFNALDYTITSPTAVFSAGNCTGSSGTIVVTAIDATKIEGTFSFTGKNSENCAAPAKNITAGSFRGVFTN